MIEVSPSFKKVGRTLQEQTSDMRSWQLSMPSESLEWWSQKAARLWVLKYRISSWFTSLEFSHSVMSNLLWPHRLQLARLPCPARSSGACLNSCPSSQWCHPTILSSVIPFSCLQSFPTSGSLHDLHHSSLCSFRTSPDFPPSTASTSFLFFSQQNPHSIIYTFIFVRSTL